MPEYRRTLDVVSEAIDAAFYPRASQGKYSQAAVNLADLIAEEDQPSDMISVLEAFRVRSKQHISIDRAQTVAAHIQESLQPVG